MIIKRIPIEQRHLPALLLVLSSLLVLLFVFLPNIVPEGTDPTNFDAQSRDNMILLTWTNPAQQTDALTLTITSGDTEQSVQLSSDSASYAFSDGVHGQLYTFTLFSGTNAAKAQSDCALFLDWERLPALPLVSIETANGQTPYCSTVTAPEGLWGVSLADNEYIGARITVSEQGHVTAAGIGKIRYRGNTSAVSDKKPYAIKLEQPLDLLGRDHDVYADTQWILLNGDYTFKTESGTQVASLCGMEWQPAFIPVNLIVNGDWQGTYLLMESVKRSSARINISNSGFIIENDAYWWKEDTVYFKTPHQIEQMAYTFQYPDNETISQETIDTISAYMTAYEQAILRGDGSYIKYIDTESYCAWLLTHDILGTWDSGGSNMFLYKYDSGQNNKLKLGPAWDFGSAFAQKDSWSRIHETGSVMYFDILMQDTAFRQAYQDKWEVISDILNSRMETYLADYVAKYGQALQQSWELDSAVWRQETPSVDEALKSTLMWFHTRTAWLDLAVYDP